MTIKIKLDQSKISAVANSLQNVYSEKFETLKHAEKVAVSIGFKVADKLQSKQKDILKKMNLLNTSKEHTISLTYYQAWAMKFLLSRYLLNSPNHRDEVKCKRVHDELDQKLV